MPNHKILVIDDSMTDFQYVKTILEKGGYDVTHALSGEEGVEQAKAEQPDCILMDVVMPKMNGFQATRALSKDDATAKIPVIMLSTKSQKTDLVWAQRQGAKDYIVKPAEPRALLGKIRIVLGA